MLKLSPWFYVGGTLSTLCFLAAIAGFIAGIPSWVIAWNVIMGIWNLESARRHWLKASNA